VRILLPLIGIVIVNLCVDSRLRLILDPLTDKELVLAVIEVTALAFSEVVDPVTLEVVSVTLGQHTVTVSLSLVPLAFVDVLVGVDHSTFALGESIDPVAIVPISILVEEGSSAMLLVFIPVACVLSA
jgi:hypothetical protein